MIITRARCLVYILGIGHQQEIAEQEEVPLLPPPASLELDGAVDKQGRGGTLR